MLTKVTFNKMASGLFNGKDLKVRLRIQAGVAYVKPTHRPHGVKGEWISHVNLGDGEGVAVFRGNVLNRGTYQLIPTSYNWYTLVPGNTEADLGCTITLEEVKPPAILY